MVLTYYTRVSDSNSDVATQHPIPVYDNRTPQTTRSKALFETFGPIKACYMAKTGVKSKDDAHAFKNSKCLFLVDSGASCHITNLPHFMLHDFTRQDSTAITAEKGGVVRCSGFGNLKGYVKDVNGNVLILSLSNVVVAPAFAHTLLSVSTLTNKRDVNVTFNKTRGFFNFSDRKISLPVGNDGLYRLHFDVIPPTGSVPKQVPRAYVITTGDIDVQIRRLHATLHGASKPQTHERYCETIILQSCVR